ncbi:Bifunctional protein FolD protein [Apilactobacillus kunkeei]|uniref:bifunctional 5,10-methylenetetrahydrofolate dehydrogenase/5,10-methenyltetrahydrofolate cyclohydrolase n=1 Tax=Apilactobacillus kunkeei TaxID=148814 RepID=UPI00110CB5AC|nr:tetrahydrofolate dehydrogenase/cyclohydrolase catalytic domain-containing protein [Apilactobacillus kunkeei]TMS99468.1 bifunctional methylenetetrahydrofolate dehydrogenase/methenyltetrahydrofolate cyclohydrolase [Apilactobacillus kunkeei]CAI2598324.1 Bifunctional protein FolD protein [Apilactobacillus kunkeei]CAI2675052.1 Bifunctional protein FolD protein [Apilactobacillus kunkeei]CAI2676326.1 Bifunctional protein FolD protein [Apilactobacillus kunkeei]CAI2677756.1 Bifunctional protein FolD
MSNIIDGRSLAKKVNQETADMVSELNEQGKNPCLAVIIVGDDQASHRYVRSKHKKAQQLGIKSIVKALPAETTEDELLNILNDYNHDDEIDAILIQSPLPKHINEKYVMSQINPDKDVDGFQVINSGKLFLNDQSNYPVACTPKGVMTMFEEYGIDLKGKKAVVIGRSTIVGRPMAALLINAGAEVTVLNHYANIKEYTLDADIIVSATGKVNTVTESDVKDGVVVIDVGQNVNDEGKLVGDVDYDGIAKKASYITPVPGGVGPMTIATLMRQTVELSKWSDING